MGIFLCLTQYERTLMITMAEEYSRWVSEILELINLQNATRLVNEGETILINCETGHIVVSKRNNSIVMTPLESNTSEFIYYSD